MGNIAVDLRMTTMKELGARWLVSACDHIRSHPDIVTNGFKKAGIAEAIADPNSISTTDPTSQNIDSEEDPFEDCDLAES